MRKSQLQRYQWLGCDLGQTARKRFRCRRAKGSLYYFVPSRTTFREVLISIDPDALDHTLQGWNEQFAQEDESLDIDGKTMRSAVDDEGHQTHIMGVVGHQTGQCHTQKSEPYSVAGSDELKQTNERGIFIPIMNSLEDIESKTVTGDALYLYFAWSRKRNL